MISTLNNIKRITIVSYVRNQAKMKHKFRHQNKSVIFNFRTIFFDVHTDSDVAKIDYRQVWSTQDITAHENLHLTNLNRPVVSSQFLHTCYSFGNFQINQKHLLAAFCSLPSFFESKSRKFLHHYKLTQLSCAKNSPK